MSEDMAKRVSQFIILRDKIKQIEKEKDELIKPLKVLKDKVEGHIQAFLDENNLENLKTAAGTCYKSSRTSAPLADPEAFMNFVKDNQAFDLIDRRANVAAVKEFVKKNKTLPPGVNLTTISTIGVRRGTGGDDE